ncbi:MAG: hypothetical protein HZA47_05040 [Planctomycetes bacterium]|uniref:hypothetical protein n=1 Tax=Candidatus Wunengus sp. YC65 TaxID=3367701 RepID=UPI001D3457F9|nr:hypothetical protein [Planctomycetota bacterium]MBI5795666.1 hypothetical protein [Planctomycetota bacterium]
MVNDIDEVNKIITGSGNNFHCKVLSYLKAKGWTVLISPYYNDNISDKPREIDLIAEKAFEAKTTRYGTINIKLFIECKYVSQKNVFWFHSKDREKAAELILAVIPNFKGNSYIDKHHYLCQPNVSVAKLFASEKNSKTENEIFYKAINQSLNSMVYYRKSKSIITSSPQKRVNIKAQISYPVIICNNFINLYKVDIDTMSEPVKIADNFQLEVNYAYIDPARNQRDEYFIIDVVDFEKIDTFLATLQSDIDAIQVVID